MEPPAAEPIADASGAQGIAALVRSVSPRSLEERVERILLDDQELLISMRCQLEQIRRELRLLNDERVVRALVERDSSLRH
jgi:transcription initiation factor IIE alpha subunit